MTDTRPELGLLGTWVRVLSIRTRLLAWYDHEKRDLPWRREVTPYRTLVSELMLQQTRVDVVVPYFERWCAIWPDFAALSRATEDEVLAAWSGLGYYRRARFLHETARAVVRDHGGALPRDVETLRTLPGIGPYTAAAIASIAFGQAVAVVDGNVERVLCRLLALQDEPGAVRDRIVREAARRLVTGQGAEGGAEGADVPERPAPALRPGDWNQALMELGATVCVPSSPRCVVCPLGRSCIGHRAGVAGDLPKRRDARATVDVTLCAALVRRGDTFLLMRRPRGSILSGLWEIPTSRDGEDLAALARRVANAVGEPIRLDAEPSRTFRHTITHRRITVRVHEARLPDATAGCVSEAGPGDAEDVSRAHARPRDDAALAVVGAGHAPPASVPTPPATRGAEPVPDAAPSPDATVPLAATRPLDAPPGVAWVTRADLRDFGVSSMTRKAVAPHPAGLGAPDRVVNSADAPTSRGRSRSAGAVPPERRRRKPGTSR